jgi:hypothetical protein
MRENLQLRFVFLLFFVIFAKDGRAQDRQDKTLSAKTNQAIDSAGSHFADALVTSRQIPKGIELADVAPLLSKKVFLRKELPKEPYQMGLESRFLTRKLSKGAVVYSDDVSSKPAKDMGEIVPPHHRLETIMLSIDLLPTLALCGEYDKALLEEDTGEETGEKKLISSNVRILDYSDQNDGDSILVSIAIPSDSSFYGGLLFDPIEEEQSPFSKERQKRDSRTLSLRCLRAETGEY